MDDLINKQRRGFLGVAASTLALAQFGLAGVADAASVKPAASIETLAGFGALQHVDAGVLNVAYVDAGPADGPPVILLHRWPYDIHAFIDVVPMLTANGFRVIVPHLRKTQYGPAV